MRRCVIVGGAEIRNFPFVRARLQEGDFVIACDSGLVHMAALGLSPDLIVGDFDSHEMPHAEVETIVLPREKDDTDTVYAVREGLARGFREFLLLGVVGGRLDHTLANVSILLMLRESEAAGRIVDDYSVMRFVSGGPERVARDCAFFSLLNVTGRTEGIDITGAKYPLRNQAISCAYQYGVSNEALPGECAQVTVRGGEALLIEVYADGRKEEQ